MGNELLLTDNDVNDEVNDELAMRGNSTNICKKIPETEEPSRHSSSFPPEMMR